MGMTGGMTGTAADGTTDGTTGGTTGAMTAGSALFARMKMLGVDWVFANSGTDFPPIIEGLIAARAAGIDLPQALTIPHEHVAVGMAHGVWQVTGRAQAVMLHTNVGLSNGATGVINAACDQVPMLVMSGRTPVMEGGRFGARTVPIGWGQEMYDQTALVREACKWDYELRFPEQVPALLDRGMAVAESLPKGPVYLSLPREVLCAPCPEAAVAAPVRMAPAVGVASEAAVAEAAALLAGAKRPLVIAQRGVGAAFEAFRAFVERWGLPVSQYWANRVSLAASSPCAVDWMPGDWLAEADVVLVIDALAPWWPDRMPLGEEARVIQLGPDPLFARTSPMRSFPADVVLAGETAASLTALMAAVDGLGGEEAVIAARAARLAERAAAVRAASLARAEAGCRAPMTKDWVGLCVQRAAGGRAFSVFHELGCPLVSLGIEDPLGYFQEPHSGGLGWGLPAAMGAKLAAPERLVFATVGDGSYMFANPVACHQVMEALGLGVVTLVLNNEEWGAVRASVSGVYPEGMGAKANEVPLTSLRPSPDFTRVAEASRGYAERVERGEDLPGALARAIAAADAGRHALLDVAIARE
ncbi:thiamine pyrophosphate-requiring protein [Sagittula sp. S175]|uniref:thiamine pyrophosphate-requiring protein n=1 Tax=Sagittula sp. S175 TaxID=3415129 RepID=UPI003C79B6A7